MAPDPPLPLFFPSLFFFSTSSNTGKRASHCQGNFSSNFSFCCSPSFFASHTNHHRPPPLPPSFSSPGRQKSQVNPQAKRRQKCTPPPPPSKQAPTKQASERARQSGREGKRGKRADKKFDSLLACDFLLSTCAGMGGEGGEGERVYYALQRWKRRKREGGRERESDITGTSLCSE